MNVATKVYIAGLKEEIAQLRADLEAERAKSAPKEKSGKSKAAPKTDPVEAPPNKPLDI